MPKAFIYPADSYVGRSLGPALVENGYDVLGAHFASTAPSYLTASYQIGSSSDAPARRQFLGMADVIIYEIYGNERATRDAIVDVSRQPFGGKQQVFLGVSTPLVWAATRPPPPSAESDDGGGGRALSPSLTLRSGVSALHPEAQAARSQVEEAQAAEVYPEGALFAKDASRRAPCLAARDACEVETLLMRAQRKGRLRTHVVCPGIMYGAGENAVTLAPLFRKAWEVQPLPVYGPGTNRLPMIHIRDMASYVVAVAARGVPEQQYLLASDGHLQTQAEVMEAIAKRLGNGETSMVPKEELLLVHGAERFMLDLFFAPTPLPVPRPGTASGATSRGHGSISAAGSTFGGAADAARPSSAASSVRPTSAASAARPGSAAAAATPASAGAPAAPAGGDLSATARGSFVADIDATAREWLEHRGVTPLRVVLSGPPASGKSNAAARLAKLYGLRHISAKDLLAAAEALDPEAAKALQAELSGKEPRASAKSMAALLKCVLSSTSVHNRGYVLDAFPKTPAQAKWAFMKQVELSPEEIAEKDKEAAAAAAAAAGKGGKDAKAGAKAPPPKKDAKGGKGAPAAGADGPEVPEGFKLVPDLELLPTHLIELEADVEELRQRLKAVEAAELDAARAATATPPTDKAKPAGKDKGPVVTGHNNEKDFGRRLDAWNKIKAEEQEELAAKVKVAQEQWERKQAEMAEARAKAEAEASTLRAKRRRARELLAAQQQQAAATGGQEAPALFGATGPLADLLAAADGDTQEPEQLSPGMTGSPERSPAASPMRGEASGSGAGSATGPRLPKHAGMVGVLVEAGVQYKVLRNPNLLEAPPMEVDAWKRLKLPALESELQQFLGPPHNFEGFPKEEAEGGSNDPGAAQGRQRPGSGPGMPGDGANAQGVAAQLAQQAQEAAEQAAAVHALKHAFAAAPMRGFLMSSVMPAVTEALAHISRDRPRDPLRVLADHLLKAAEKVEASYVDPYTDKVYEIQAKKIKAKADRDAARAAAAHAKAERELAAKMAAKQAAMAAGAGK